MKLTCLFVSGRSAALQLEDGGLYNTLKPYTLRINGERCVTTVQVVTNLYGLWPDTEYTVEVLDGEEQAAVISFHTAFESVTLNVHRFGAIGDGVHDDTPAIQAAILCCPEKGRVLIPKGKYVVTPLFLKSHMSIELTEGAELCLNTDRHCFPILPGAIETTDETGDYNLGTWEGNPLDAFAALITGVDVEDVSIYGPGKLNGRADQADWWVNRKQKNIAWRGRMVFLCRCSNVTLQGVSVCNSPSWNLHPYFSNDLKFIGISVTAPADSPNTDGFDPESCKNVLLAGAHFSLGDDCIAIKAGKIYMGSTYKTPCKHVEITHCLMENGHGGVTIGSEMAGGVHDVLVHDCLMRNTDRGLRVKTRRGRGKDGVIDEIVFERVKMERVGAPFVVNCLYFCDPDGHTAWVQSREKYPVDDSTPRVGKVIFRDVQAEDCGACAGYFLGLPEQTIEQVEMENVTFTFDKQGKPMPPAMAENVEPCLNQGIIAKYVDRIVMKNVHMTGQAGEALSCEQVAHVEGA